MHATYLRNRLRPSAALILEVDQNILKRLPPPFEQLRRYTLRNSDFILGRHPDALDVVHSCGYRGASGLIAYGIDETDFHPHDRVAARNAIGASGFVLGYVGRIIREKGLEDAIRAIPLIGRPVELFLLGEGPVRERASQAC